MVNISEKELEGFFRESMDSEVSIIYKKEAGMDGDTTLQIIGPGSMLFDGICTVLKELALAEAKEHGNGELAVKYAQTVCSIVCSELEGEG